MHSKLPKRLCAIIGSIVIAGCASTPLAGRTMEERVGDDIASFNQAYADATNDLILWNILRARDRLPRSYVAIKDIATTQTRSFENNFGLSSLDLGGDFANDPWGIATLGGRSVSQSAPAYGVSPLDSRGISAAVQAPVPSTVFQHYWNSWGPADVVMAVLVQRATRLQAGPEVFANLTCAPASPATAPTVLQRYFPSSGVSLNNEFDEPGASVGADFSARNLAAAPEASGAQFLRLARWAKEGDDVRLQLIETRRCNNTANIPLRGANRVSLEHATALATAMVGEAGGGRIRLSENGQTLEVRASDTITGVLLIMAGPDIPEDLRGVWELELRSFDGAVYYLGETIREPSAGPLREAYRASRDGVQMVAGPVGAPANIAPSMFGVANVVSADCDDVSVNAPLFRVRRVGRERANDVDGWNYDAVVPAARVTYRDAVYESGPPSPLNSSCNTPVDFSGQVLSLLTQLLSATFTPEALRLPARLN